MSCAGNGYLSANELVPFPFDDGQCLGWECQDRNGAQMALQKCFVDAGIFIRSTSIPEGEWPAIGMFSTSGSSIGFMISYNGSDTRQTVVSSSTRFPVVSGNAPWGSYVIVLSSEGIRQFCEFCYSHGVSPPSSGSSSPSGTDGDFFLRVCARCVTLAPAALSSICVYDGVNQRSSGPHFVLRGDVSIKAGNNVTAFSQEDDASIEIAAVPGEGLGRIPCSCSGSKGVSPQLSSPDGHVRIFNGTCYDLEPVGLGTIFVNGKARPSRTLMIHAKCSACCQCSMYESIVNDRLSSLFDSVRASKVRLDEIASEYESSVARFNERMSKPELSDITMSISGTPVRKKLGSILSGTGIKGRMCRCAFSSVIRNSSFALIKATVNSISGTDTIAEASASWSDKEGNPLSMTSDSRSGITGATFDIHPGRSLVISFVSVKEKMSEYIEAGSFIGSVSVGFSYEQGSLSGSLGTIKKTVVT